MPRTALAWCPRCFAPWGSTEEAPTRRPIGRLPRPPSSRTKAGTLSFGLAARMLLSVIPVALVVYGWSGIVQFWGTPRMVLDLLWVPATTVVSLLWLRGVWANAPVIQVVKRAESR